VNFVLGLIEIAFVLLLLLSLVNWVLRTFNGITRSLRDIADRLGAIEQALRDDPTRRP